MECLETRTIVMPNRLGTRYFFGRFCGSWHRLQRVSCELIFPPHFGQRRPLSFMANLVRERVFMGDLILGANYTMMTDNKSLVDFRRAHKREAFFLLDLL